MIWSIRSMIERTLVIDLHRKDTPTPLRSQPYSFMLALGEAAGLTDGFTWG
jgi:hypothetical protein